MAQKTYVSLDNLNLYHELEVARTAAEAAQALSDAKAYVDEKTEGIASSAVISELQTKVNTEIERAQAAEKAITDALGDTTEHGTQTTVTDTLLEMGEVIGTFPEAFTDTNITDVLVEFGYKLGLTNENFSDSEDTMYDLYVALKDHVGVIDENNVEIPDEVVTIGDAVGYTMNEIAGLSNDVEENTRHFRYIEQEYLKIIDANSGILAQANAYADGKDEAIAAAKKAGDDAQDSVDALAAKVGDVAEGKTVVEMISDAQTAATYDDTKVKEDIKANADAIAVLNNGVETEGSVDYKIAQAVAAIMENPDDTMNSINELVTWINGHAEDALELSNKVTANEGAIAALEGKAHEHTFDEAVLNGITAAKVSAWDSAEQNAKDYADGLAGDYDAAGSAATAETNAKSYADGLNTAMDSRVDALEALVGEGMEAIAEADIRALFA